ncbi:MAG: ubiquinone biosynthesis protein [Micavibrio sp.]|nr:ubiquinone biosynthesis protein [Micavibrio sp.]|tara:strand:+ start:2603 stop:3820 length:1218 start_codon:yes stop_codon:yes gene_type:complete
MKTDFDIIVVGGGLAGLTAAILLAQYNFKVLCLDGQKAKDVLTASHDGRTTAISYGSKLLLESGGLWSDLEKDACPIKDIHIRDSKTPTLLRFLSEEVEGRSFGWIVDNLILRQHLIRTAQNTKNLTYKDGMAATDFIFDINSATVKTAKNNYTSKLIIGADGRNSPTRHALDIPSKSWSYGQSAIVFWVTHTKPHDNIAVEHFRAQGPFAILPMTSTEDGQYRSSVVWSEHGDSHFFNADDESFLAAVQTRFGDYFGQVLETGQRFSYPLSFSHADYYIGKRAVLIAEAAHVMHPIAGQGLNMSLRDVAALIECVVDATKLGQDIGHTDILNRYQTWRKNDNRMMGMATDGLNKLFSNDNPAIRLIRNIGLEAVRHFKPAKQLFMRQAMGHMGNLPKLTKGEKL